MLIYVLEFVSRDDIMREICTKIMIDTHSGLRTFELIFRKELRGTCQSIRQSFVGDLDEMS